MATITANAPDGASLNIDVPEGIAPEAYPQLVDEAVGHYMSTKQSPVESGLRAAVNNLPLGGQIGAVGTAALKGEDYSKALNEFNQKAAEGKAQHPIAYGTGAVAGALAPLAIPGVGEAVAAAPEATGAALGAANAVGNTNLAQNPGEALKQAAIGAGSGAVLGSVLPTGAGAAEDLENLANRKTVESVGLPQGLLNIPKEEMESYGKTMHEMGLDQGTIDDKVNVAAAKLKDVGGQIGALGAEVPPLTDAEPFINELHDKIKESSDIFGAGANPEAPLYQAGIDKLSQPNLSFEQLQKMKTAIGQRAFDSLGNVKNDAAANLYGVYKDAMKSMVQGAPEDYQDLMTQYGHLMDINDALGKVRGKLNAGGLPGKPIGMMGKLGSMVTGGNVPATAALAGAVAPFHPYMGAMLGASLAGNPEAVSTAARAGAEALPAVASAFKLGTIDSVTSYLMHTLQNAPQKLGRYAQPLLQAAQSGGSQGLAAQHYILSSQYPEYNSMIMQKENSDEELRKED